MNYKITVDGITFNAIVEPIDDTVVSLDYNVDYGHNKIYAPLNGKVEKIYCKNGDTIKEGQKVFSFDAMNVKYDIEALFDGEVDKIYCKEGDSVLNGCPIICYK